MPGEGDLEALAGRCRDVLRPDMERVRSFADRLEEKTGGKSVKPSLEGVEVNYDTSILMEEDLSLFGSQREEILAQFETLMGDKAVNE